MVDKITDLEAINIELNSYNKILKERNEILQKETNYLRNEKEEYKRLYEDSFGKQAIINQSQDLLKNSRQLNKIESSETLFSSKENSLTTTPNGVLKSNKQLTSERRFDINELSKKQLRFNNNDSDTSNSSNKLDDKSFDWNYDICKKTLNEVN